MIDASIVKELIYIKDGEVYWSERRLEMFHDSRIMKSWNTRYANKIAFKCTDTYGYRQSKIFGRSFTLHKVMWAFYHNEWPSSEVDHINGNKLDNSKENLRLATRGENNRNVTKRKSNTSGFKGVSWNKGSGKWVANIGYNGKQIYLGLFTDINKANDAYIEASKIYHRDFSMEAHDDKRNQPE